MQLPNLLNQPTLMQTYQWITDPVGFMESSAQTYPDLFSAQLIGFEHGAVFVQHPQALQTIVMNERRLFPALGKENRIVEPMVGSQSIIMLDGDRHKRQRQLMLPPFHGERLKAYGQLIIQLAQAAFARVPWNQPFTARRVTQEISLEVILQSVFGLQSGERYQQLKRLLTSVSNQFESPWKASALFLPVLQQDWGKWSLWGQFLQQRSQIDQLLYTEIAERRAHPDPERIDILSLLIAARDEDGNPMTDQELRDELMTLLLAGNETTATAIAWSLYWVHALPEVQARVLQELRELENADPIAKTRLPYLTAVCQETLRIYPVGMLMFPRIVQEATELLGYPLEPDTVLMGCIYLLHQRPDLYPEPKQFKPERFLERQFSPYEYMPFGGGVRRCIGEALAMMELKLVVAEILSTYEMALADSRPETPRRRGITLGQSRGVRLKIVGQRQQATPPVPDVAIA
jgi:cytochrome P450